MIVGALADEGISPADVLQRIGLTEQRITSPNTRVSWGDMIQCCRTAIRLSRDPFFGYRAGLRVHVTTFGIYGFAILSSPDFRQATWLPAKYNELSMPLTRLSFTETDHRGIWSIDPTLYPAVDAPLCRFLIENQFGVLTALFRDVMGPAFVPLELQVTYQPSQDLRTYQDVFGCGVRFGQPANRLVFDAAWLDSAPRYGNRIAFLEALKLCDAALIQLRSRKGVAGLVRQVLRQDLSRSPRLETVARDLTTSTRTLRRRLQAENTSFRTLVEEVWTQAAFDYLRDPNLTVERVAELLGFSDASNFRHAFRRWTNHTPAEVRERWISAEASPGQPK
ncbi:MAG TPA: AraC family transcriptional regulator [Bradyrhizobium sp.]|nr:AraC family transcriptional regulator [Bradyrhizobium sp.]